MNESKHTPGPLEIVEAKTIDTSGKWHVYLAAPDGRKIAALWGSQDEKIANAHLFIAAPNMLAALEKLLFWNEGIAAGRGNYHPQDHIELIRSAIKDGGRS